MPYSRNKVESCLKAMRSKQSKGRVLIKVGGPRIVLLRDDADDVSAGGIIIPDQAKIIPRKGTVLVIGDGVKHVANEYTVEELEVGDYVTFNAYDGVEHDIDTDMGTLPVLVTHVRNVYLYGPREV